MPYLLHKDPMALPAPTNHPRVQCEKYQANNSFESILKDVLYSIVVGNITAEETMGMTKGFPILFLSVL